ncbi:MAG: SRPBCC domain-containing protein [Pseudomonadota bacterium]
MDAIFKALNDANRRALLDTLRQKDGQTLQQLEQGLAMTRFGVMKHLKVLEEASLIATRKQGRYKYHYLNALPLQEVIDRWLEPLLVQPSARKILDLKAKLEGAAAMSQQPDFMMSTYIRCSQDALWAALTDPDQIGAYHFLASRCERHGNQLVYFTPDEARMLVCTHTEEVPKTRIESTFEPYWEGPDMTGSRFVYVIEPEAGYCKLSLEHHQIPAGQEGVADGWSRFLSGLKTYLETGATPRFSPTMAGADA